MNRCDQKITINRINYSSIEILESSFVNRFPDEFGKGIAMFLQQWFEDGETVQLQTSGSTGIPKIITAKKNAMIHSAWMTCKALDLSDKTNALLCLPISAIAGKMMLVRALVSGMNVDYVAPCGNPLHRLLSVPDFVAMVPLQVYNSLQNPKETKILQQIKNLIIGGGFVDDSIVNSIKDFTNNIYVTYGMTETLSHIALRKLTGAEKSNYYTPFSSINLSLSPEACLQIVASHLFNNMLVTNDIAEIREDGSFQILGRKDNTINTGGVKIQIEALEQQLSAHINGDFAITSMVDAKFGEVIVLLYTLSFDRNLAFANLSPYQVPKHLFQVSSIPSTHTGKIDRAKCRELVNDKK